MKRLALLLILGVILGPIISSVVQDTSIFLYHNDTVFVGVNWRWSPYWEVSRTCVYLGPWRVHLR